MNAVFIQARSVLVNEFDTAELLVIADRFFFALSEPALSLSLSLSLSSSSSSPQTMANASMPRGGAPHRLLLLLRPQVPLSFSRGQRPTPFTYE